MPSTTTSGQEFLTRYGFGPSRRYLLLHDGRLYDSKAIMGVAHGFEFPDQGPLRSAEFSGGLTGAAGKLRAFGFDVRDTESAAAALAPRPAPQEQVIDIEPSLNVVALVGCVKGKGGHPALARDLYTSDMLRKRRAYVERNRMPWLILSALHGVVAPDERLEPYDLALVNQSGSYRRQWGERVVEQLRSTGRWKASASRRAQEPPTWTPSGNP